MDCVLKTIVEEDPKLYSAFPTITILDDCVYIFYRQGVRDLNQPHGFAGKVKMIKVSLENLINFFNNTSQLEKEEKTIFEGENEIDAVVSKIDENLFALATRIYVKNIKNQPYISVSDDCNFKERIPISIKNVNIAAFYGKVFKSKKGYIFPAYGNLIKEDFTRPLILISDDFEHFELLSYLESSEDLMLNESSILYANSQYQIFSRKDIYPFAIYTSISKDLTTWQKPEKLIDFALAPMALKVNSNVYISFRDIHKGVNKISLYNIHKKTKIILDTYSGSLFDGGYSDLLHIENFLLVVYYTNNIAPYIKMAKVNIS